jgi:outer membrane protein OmpA-like peptidoglycan-associated protein
MRLLRTALALCLGSTILMAAGQNAIAEDVSVNLDALGPETPAPAKKPSKPVSVDAVRSEVVPDPEPAQAETARPSLPKQTQRQPVPMVKPEPSEAAVSKPRATGGEIDFIGKTKKTQPVASAAEPAAVQLNTGNTKPPVMATPIPDDPAPASQTAVPRPAPVAITAPVAPPSSKANPASIVVNSGAIGSGEAPPEKPRGAPLTSIKPSGALFIPNNVNALPEPVATSKQDVVEEEEVPSSLTLPPSLPEAPTPAPASAPEPSANAAPQSTQTVAAAASVASRQSAPMQSRASVLAGHATALEVTFEPGKDVLGQDQQAALDQIAESLKSTGLRAQLAAYSGPPGNDTSDSRRMSLKRALAVREYLGKKGVQRLTVNISAFGGAVVGQSDRVDVMVRTDEVGRLTATP